MWLTVLTLTAFVICVSWWWCQSPALRRRHWVIVLGGVLLGVTTITKALYTIHQGFEDPTASRFTIAFLAGCVASLLIAAGLVQAEVLR